MLRRAAGTSLQGLAVDELGGRIGRQQVGPGQVLDPGRLADEFGVSRSIIREAFRTLETLGMIDARPRVGTVVRPSTDWDLLDHRVIGWRDGGPAAADQLRELTVLREAVEPTAAALAAVRATEREVDTLRVLHEEMSGAMAADDVRSFARADAAFHALIVQASRSEVLQQLLTTLEATLHSRFSDRLPGFSEASVVALERHRELVEALGDRDGERAAVVTRLLVRESQVELFRIESPS